MDGEGSAGTGPCLGRREWPGAWCARAEAGHGDRDAHRQDTARLVLRVVEVRGLPPHSALRASRLGHPPAPRADVDSGLWAMSLQPRGSCCQTLNRLWLQGAGPLPTLGRWPEEAGPQTAVLTCPFLPLCSGLPGTRRDAAPEAEAGPPERVLAFLREPAGAGHGGEVIFLLCSHLCIWGPKVRVVTAAGRAAWSWGASWRDPRGRGSGPLAFSVWVCSSRDQVGGHGLCHPGAGARLVSGPHSLLP